MKYRFCSGFLSSMGTAQLIPKRLRWLGFYGAVVVAAFAGCSRGVDSTSPNPGKNNPSIPLAIQLNWYPESEHGGVYQAAADGTYESAQLDVTIKPGGANSPVAAELELGRAQFAITNADDVVLFRRSGSTVVAVAAVVQNSPRCILVRKDSGVTSLSGLAGMTLQRQPGRSYLEFLRSKGILDNVREVPYLGSVAGLVADPKIAIQAYLFSEPLLAREAGADVLPLMVSELGWNPYSSVLVTTESMIQKHPDQVQSFVDATLAGWRNYLSDPSDGNEAILAANRHGMTAAALRYGQEQLTGLALPDSATIETVGTMLPDRWQTLVQQMDSLDPEAAGKVSADQCYTLQFLRQNANP